MADSTSVQHRNAADPLSPDTRNHTDATGNSIGHNNTSASSLSFSLHDNQLTSYYSPTKESSTCCGRTDAETELSSNQSQACGGEPTRDVRPLYETPSTCMGCIILPTIQSGEMQQHKNCFVVIDCSSSPDKPGYEIPYPDASIQEVPFAQAKDPLTNQIVPEISRAILTPRTVHSKEVSEANYGATMASTSNTLHRRSDISHMGLFTAQTLDAIYSGSPEVIEEEAGTPNDQDSQRDVGTASKGVRQKYQTPTQRERIDSDSFRRTMEVVTCEKRSDNSGDSDVSSIALDAFFSPTLEENEEIERTPPAPLPPSSSRKRLIFDSGSLRQRDTPNPPRITLSEEIPAGRNKFQLSSPAAIGTQRAPPLSALGMSVMSSFQCVMRLLQSIARGSRRCRPTTCQRCPRKPHPRHGKISSSMDDTKGCWISGNGKHVPNILPTTSRSRPTSTTKGKHQVQSSFRRAGEKWEDTFLQKSSTFLKELRRFGQRGEVIIQGWVAFRAGSVASWDGIIDNPKRGDFRYIILLEDSTLHLFKSRNKTKGKERISLSQLDLPPPKTDSLFLQDFVSLNLTAGDNIAVRINHVSKEYGNEVCIFHPETEEVHCSLLPMPMPPNIFLDRHKSRLRKGEVLQRVFLEPFRETSNTAPDGSSSAPSSILSTSTSTDDDIIVGTPKASTSTPPSTTASAATNDSDVSPAPTEQYDVSRHVLFAIDAAIRIPVPIATSQSKTIEKGGHV